MYMCIRIVGCTFIAVSLAECPSYIDGRELSACTMNMTHGQQCNAGFLDHGNNYPQLPDGNPHYDVANCYGSVGWKDWDDNIFKCVKGGK